MKIVVDELPEYPGACLFCQNKPGRFHTCILSDMFDESESCESLTAAWGGRCPYLAVKDE